MSIQTPSHVPTGLVVAASWAWRLLIVAFAIATAAVIAYQLRLVTVPIFLAILATTFLVPPARYLERKGLSAGLATTCVFVGSVGIATLTTYLLSAPVARQFRDLGPQLTDAMETVEKWLLTGPFQLSNAELDEYVNTAMESLKGNSSAIGSGVATGAHLLAEGLTGFFVALILSILFVKDGEKLFTWWVNRLPAQHRDAGARAGSRAWHTLGGYLRGVALTGVVDAVLIGIALLIIGVPLVLPLMLLTFLGAFFPVVGALLAGLVAALIALVNGGPVDAGLVVIAALVVQQVEGHVLQPVVMGRALSLHPSIIIISLTTGAVIAGFLGAFLAVPFAAVVSAVARELSSRNENPSAGSLTESSDRGAQPQVKTARGLRKFLRR